MEILHDILINLLSDATWALGGFLLAYLLKKAINLHGIGNETIAKCYNKKNCKVLNKRLSISPYFIMALPGLPNTSFFRSVSVVYYFLLHIRGYILTHRVKECHYITYAVKPGAGTYLHDPGE